MKKNREKRQKEKLDKKVPDAPLTTGLLCISYTNFYPIILYYKEQLGLPLLQVQQLIENYCTISEWSSVI